MQDRAEPVCVAASALLTSAAAAWLLIAGPDPRPRNVVPAEPPAAIELAVVEPSPTPQPPPTPVPPQAAPPAAAEPAPPLQEQQAPVRLPPPRRPRRRTARPAPDVAQQVAAPAQQTMRPVQDAAAAPPRRSPENPTEDALYSGLVRATIERHKRNPDSPAYRMMRPHGTATVAFMLSRDGEASGIRVAAGSGAGMLDAQAVAIVESCRFPPMPTAAFAGAASHLFQVEITFPPFGGAD